MRVRSDRVAEGHGATSGYTLLELMIVIVIVAVVSALAVPGIINTLRENRTYQGASDIARLFRQARLDAVGRGAATAVRWQRVGATPRGRFEMWRSPVSSCSMTNWTTAAQPTSATLFTALDFSQSPYQVTGGADIRAEYCSNLDVTRTVCTAGAAEMWVCYSPAGRVFWSTTGAGFTDNPTGGAVTIGGGWPFLVRRFESGAPISVSRVAFVPFGAGGARVQQ
ncbi:MAG: prepilin-type N-terminal cleavage/methylation domain-containing protein [Deltaproteobacteria bacterium]|nr:prepilin-type N-terminal cleavage/methylation domain-containing protein [Deltaproteobacteria bacterium]